MDSNLKIILEEFEQLKGQFIITYDNKISRLVAIGTDNEDYYYITYNGKKLLWESCVGSIIPLKGYLREKDYNDIIRRAKLNHYDFMLEKEHISQFKCEIVKNLGKNDLLLTELCFDLN